MAGKRALVIVESPTKAVSLAKFLGSGYMVESSRGHVRDLPTGAAEVPAKYKGEKWARTGVNIEADFEPLANQLPKDYDRFGTRGHIDIIATFAPTGVVLAHVQRDPAHPDFEVCRENLGILRSTTDAAGRPIEVVEVPAPVAGDVDGELVDWSYINHYVCNGAVILCSFDDPNDEVAAEIIARAYPGRQIVLHDAREIFACGGGIHCITQQQPLS